MDEKDAECITLMKEITLEELSKGAEFQIDVDFRGKKKKNEVMLMDDEDLMDNPTSTDDESGTEDVLRNIEQSAELQLLSSPEYKSFDDIATTMIDCLPCGGVKILIVEEGEGPLVPTDAEVTIHYAAYWEKERLPFDCTLSVNLGQPQNFRLSMGELLPGIEIGLTTVKGPKAVFHLLVEPQYAWGKMGIPPRIRPERCLFTVSLLAVKDMAAVEFFNQLPRKDQQSFETTLKFVTASKQKAKEFFKRKLYKKSLNTYLKSMSVIEMSCPETEAQTDELKKMKSTVYLNLAICYTKLDRPNKVLLMLGYLSRVTDIENHAKGLFYYGKAYTMLGNYSEAENYFKKALKIEPTNPDIGRAMADLDKIVTNGERNEKELWKNAFRNDEKSYNIDNEFLQNIKATCHDLGQRTEYTKINLPNGLTNDEVECIQGIAKDYDKVIVVQDGEGRRKKISLIKMV